MGRYAKASMNSRVRDMLSACPYRCNNVEDNVVHAVKIGTQIREGLVKPISSPLLTGLGYDGDVEGIDVNPKQDNDDE